MFTSLGRVSFPSLRYFNRFFFLIGNSTAEPLPPLIPAPTSVLEVNNTPLPFFFYLTYCVFFFFFFFGN